MFVKKKKSLFETLRNLITKDGSLLSLTLLFFLYVVFLVAIELHHIILYSDENISFEKGDSKDRYMLVPEPITISIFIGWLLFFLILTLFHLKFKSEKSNSDHSEDIETVFNTTREFLYTTFAFLLNMQGSQAKITSIAESYLERQDISEECVTSISDSLFASPTIADESYKHYLLEKYPFLSMSTKDPLTTGHAASTAAIEEEPHEPPATPVNPVNSLIEPEEGPASPDPKSELNSAFESFFVSFDN